MSNETTQQACATANKVSLLLRYLPTTADRAVARSMIDEAFLLTLELMNQLDGETLAKQYAQQHTNFSIQADTYRSDHGLWSEVIATSCEALRSWGCQEKLVAVLGDELDGWDFESPEPATLDQDLIRLAQVCSTAGSATTDAMLSENEATKPLESTIDRFSKAVCGLAVLLSGLDEARALSAATATGPSAVAGGAASSATVLTNFGAYLLSDRVPSLA